MPQRGRIEIAIDGVRVEVSPELEAVVHRAYKGLCQPLPLEMTTTQAAGFLDVSRPFVIKLIKQKLLPCRMVGKHRRIPADALVEYREKMFQRAKNAADEMVQLSQALGLYDTEGPSTTKAKPM
ncbi:MAG TPA: helix-turn-helix domain-containing protein [Gemmataceae bacterium]|nr:helix-turn-helix domain-containing protein [Gemmataceae bacterium]